MGDGAGRSPVRPPPSYLGASAEKPVEAFNSSGCSEDIRGRSVGTRFEEIFRLRNDAIKSLCSSVRRFRDATINEECKGDYPHALQALSKALDRAEDLI